MLEFVNIRSVRFYDQLIYDHHVVKMCDRLLEKHDKEK